MTKVLVAFVMLQVADIATTIVALNLGGAETNPLMRVFMSAGPIAGLMLAKTTVLLIAAGCAAWKKQWPLRCANAAFGVIVAWNLSVIARLSL